MPLKLWIAIFLLRMVIEVWSPQTASGETWIKVLTKTPFAEGAAWDLMLGDGSKTQAVVERVVGDRQSWLVSFSTILGPRGAARLPQAPRPQSSRGGGPRKKGSSPR